MPHDLKTDKALLDKLQAAAHRNVGAEELRRQRLSYVYGNMPEGMTKHEVRKALERLEGAAA